VNIFDELDDIQPQFVGFFTTQIQDNVVTILHIHSFALYYTQNIMLKPKPTKTTGCDMCTYFSNPHSINDAGLRISSAAAFTT
jgi:hypothetical protein